jgi:hypothetical protein
VAGELQCPLPPPRQFRTSKHCAGFDSAGSGEPSQLVGEVALQRSFGAFSRRQIPQQQMKPLRLFGVRGPLMTRTIHQHPRVVLLLLRLGEFQWLLERQGLYLQDQPLVTSSSPVSIKYPSRESLPVLMNCLSPHYSFAMTSDRSTLVDQPAIMLRSGSHPSAKTRITCGTTKRMKSHMSQICHTRAASKPPNSAASQWSCIGL